MTPIDPAGTSNQSFAVSGLIGLFRKSLLALIPIAEEARIQWRGPEAYDPWENIERVLFEEIVASVIVNAAPRAFCPLPAYGIRCTAYLDRSFISERSARLRGERLLLLELVSGDEPFDTARFLKVDARLVPTGHEMELPLAQAKLELAALAKGATGFAYLDVVEYRE